MTSRPLQALGISAAVLAGTACQVDLGDGYVEREEKRYEVGGAADLSLYTFDGSIEIRSWERSELGVEIEKRGQDREAVSKIEILEKREGDRIQIEARRPGGRSTIVGIGRFTSPGVRFVASVPRATHVVARSGDGSINVQRLDGRLELRTADGSIRVTETTGDLLAESGDGSIHLDMVSGRIDARTDDGQIRVSGTPGALRLRTGDGAVVLRIRAGAVMTEDWTVSSADGSISVELPDGFNAEIEAEPGSDSRVRHDVGLTNVSGGTRQQRRLVGRLGEGGHRLFLRTHDGTIRLTRY